VSHCHKIHAYFEFYISEIYLLYSELYVQKCNFKRIKMSLHIIWADILDYGGAERNSQALKYMGLG